MKIKQKISLITISMMLILNIFMITNTFAETNEEDFFNTPTLSYEEILFNKNSKVINEYVASLEMANRSEEELLNLNFSYKDIERIKSTPDLIKEKISELSKKSEEELKEMGIDYERISIIKSVEGLEPINIPDEIAIQASANMSFSLEGNGLNSSRAIVLCNWAWNKAPMFNIRDYVLFSWTNGFVLNEKRTSMKIDYYNLDNEFTSSNRINAMGQVNGAKFEFWQSDSAGFKSKSRGKAFVYIDNLENKKYIEVLSKYFHNVQGIPSFSISFMGISINLSSGFGSFTGEDYIQIRK